ncbi:MAG: hypothetical protein ACT4PX_00475 [Actinomycetota bacterium]
MEASSGTGGGLGRRFAWFGLAVAAVAAAAIVVVSVRDGGTEAGSAHFERTFPDSYVGTVWFSVAGSADQPHQVTVTWGRLQRTFEHRGPGAATYVVTKGVGKERSGPLVVNVDPAADVTFNHGDAPPEGKDLSSTPWTALPHSSGVQAPRPANADSRVAWAAVDESVSYGGMDPSGIGVRPEPRLEGVDAFTRANHGTVYPVHCWSTGQAMTNSNWSDPADDNAAYNSDIWWWIETPEGRGYVPDVWLARRGTTDKLNLAQCPEGPR